MRCSASVLAMLLVLVIGSPSSASRAHGEEGDLDAQPVAVGETSFDGAGAVLVSVDGRPLPAELVIRNFASSGMSVRWAANAIPVLFCTVQANRPASVTAEQFRESVRQAVEMWNGIEAAVGIHYTGDCATARVDLDNNLNEIAWDDARNLVSGSQAGMTQGSWVTAFGRRDFAETDIVLDHRLRVPDACLRTIMAHELGHAIGFGHSDSRADLMFPSFNASDLSTCRPTASADEEEWLVALYGANRRPVLTPPGDREVMAGARVLLSVQAADPEGDALTYEWRQVAGTPTAISADGSAVSLVAPDRGTVTLEVAAMDRYLHRSTARLTLTVDPRVPAGPPLPPSLQSVSANADRSGSTLKWGERPDARSHEFCTTTLAGAATCTAQASPVADAGWSTVLSSGGQAGERTVLALDMRKTGMRACNAAGCSAPGAGPLMGGLRWGDWGISYDVFAMAFDVPGTAARFTIAGVVNLGTSAREFSIYTGPEGDAERVRLRDCGWVEPGQTCIGYAGPSDDAHGDFAVVGSAGAGTPGTVHRVRIR